MLKILCYKNEGIHWYPCHPTFLWKINFTLVWRLISALIRDISGQWNRSHGRDFREKRIVFSRFLTPYLLTYIHIQILSVYGCQSFDTDKGQRGKKLLQNLHFFLKYYIQYLVTHTLFMDGENDPPLPTKRKKIWFHVQNM